MKQYDIFISYRRSSYDTANLVATRLKSAGYSVFFDMETLRSGKFNEQLFEVIDNCKDFVVILPPNALDRCVNEDDWVRLEVCRAMEAGKNIVPVMLNGFAWPNPMPQGMEDLCNYQALTASSVEYFDLAMERLQQRYLQSKRHFPVRRVAKVAGISIASLLVILTILWGVFMMLSQEVCKQYATIVGNHASSVHVIAEQNNYLNRNWDAFVDELAREDNPQKIEVLKNDMLGYVDLVEKNIQSAWVTDTTEMVISGYDAFLLSLHGINAEELKIIPLFSATYFKDYLSQLDIVRNAVLDSKTINLEFADVLFDVSVHSNNSFYASILSVLSLFPDKAKETIEEMRKQWTYFDKYELNADQKYYEDIVLAEGQKAEALMSEHRTMLNKDDAELDDLEMKAEQLEQDIDEKLGTLEDIVEINEQTKAEIAKIETERVKAYNTYKKKCAFNGQDNQWEKWGKVRLWGYLLSFVAEQDKALLTDGVVLNTNITAQSLVSEMNKLLSDYQTSYPNSSDYVSAARAFYQEVALSGRPYSGVLVFAFKDNVKHPTLEVGDIIVEYAGAPVKTINDFTTLYKKHGNAEAKFLRYTNGRFVDKKWDWKENGDVGFLDLVQ